MRSRHWAIAAAALLAACQGEEGPPGTPGNDGEGYIALERNGVVGLVTDPGGAAVSGGTVYFVPATDVRDLGTTTTAVNSDTDEPLEDAIRRFGAGYAQVAVGTEGADKGVYRLTSLPAGSYFVTYMPAGTDYLPGGSLCRIARASSALVDTRLDIEVSAAIPAGAQYVGSSRCIGCHGRAHISGTMHRLGIWSPYYAGPLQDVAARRDDLYAALDARFATGTTVYFFGYDPSRSFDKYQTWETDPALAAWAASTLYVKGAIVSNGGQLYEAITAGTSASSGGPAGAGTGITDGTAVWKSIPGVSFTVQVYKSAGGEYRMLITDVAGSSGTVDRKVDAIYGGGVNKQRYLTKIGSGSDFYYATLPLQFNSAGTDGNRERTSKVWRDYHGDWWYAGESGGVVAAGPAASKSFEKNCISCHAVGVKVDPTTFRAQTVKDLYFGDFDYDGDGVAEELNIGCETCHGPGSAHWNQGGRGKHIVALQLLTPEREAIVCGQCHSRPAGKFGTDSPVSAAGLMMIAGTSRNDYLQNHAGGGASQKLDATAADLWGDGGANASGIDHSKAHHQQYTDFIKSKLYKNATELMTCSSCHDPHGKTYTPEGAPIARQLRKDPYDNAGLCGSCHDASQPALEAHVRAKVYYPSSGTHPHSTVAKCVDCHMPKTAKTGSGQPTGLVGADSLHEYWWNDVTSHVFDAPLKAASIAKKVPTAYTNPCGTCHTGNGM